MIVNLTKIFPKSCTINYIGEVIIDTTKIIKLSIDDSVYPSEYSIRLERTIYKFSSTGNDSDGAMESLAAICLAEKGLRMWKNISQHAPELTSEHSERVIELSKKTINYYQKEVGVNKTTPTLNN